MSEVRTGHGPIRDTGGGGSPTGDVRVLGRLGPRSGWVIWGRNPAGSLGVLTGIPGSKIRLRTPGSWVRSGLLGSEVCVGSLSRRSG